MKSTLVALTLLALWPAAAARAEVEPLNNSYSEAGPRIDWGRLLERAHLNYAALAEGSSVSHLDGNRDGRGTHLEITNYLNGEFDLGDAWRGELGGEFKQYFRPENPKKPGRPNFETRDPFVGLSRSNLFATNTFGLRLRSRFFLPVSPDTIHRVGKTWDTGHGTLFLAAALGWKLGRWSIGLPLETYINFAKAPVADREDFSLKAKLQFAYQWAAHWSARLEYNTGDVRHTRLGHWSKMNDVDTGQKLTAGVAYTPVRALRLSPSVVWGRENVRLTDPALTLHASYDLL